MWSHRTIQLLISVLKNAFERDSRTWWHTTVSLQVCRVVTLLFPCLAANVFAVTVKSTVKTEKKTVQFSEDVQVETIEPEQEPVFIDEVSSLVSTLFKKIEEIRSARVSLKVSSHDCWNPPGQDGPATADDPECGPHGQPVGQRGVAPAGR